MKPVTALGRRFPILEHYRYRGPRRSIPWSIVEPHEAQARLNHGQSLERLAERGGLSVDELWAVMHGVYWRRETIPPAEELERWFASLEGAKP